MFSKSTKGIEIIYAALFFYERNEADPHIHDTDRAQDKTCRDETGELLHISLSHQGVKKGDDITYRKAGTSSEGPHLSG